MEKSYLTNPTIFLPFLFVMIFFPSSSHSWIIPSNDGNVSECAYLFSEPDFKGYNLSARDGRDFFQLSQNFYETNITSTLQHWDKLARGFQLQEGCVVYACSDTYFDGNCTSITEDQPQLQYPLDQNISSFSCNCYKDCTGQKCNQIELSETECGRAFIEPGCNACQRVYITLKPTNVSYIGAYENSIQSVVLNPGCTLIAYEDRDFEGQQMSFQGGIYDNWRTPIVSYECVCDFKYILGRKDVPENAVRPTMLDMPRTVEEITGLLDGKNRRHKGLLSALRSMKSRRSAKNAYILLLGLTGSGKSSTINMLFDNVTIAEVGHSGSTTSQIIEYRVPVPVDELGIRNSELRIIDTPGLGDTRGLEFDAQFLASLDDWLDTHEELQNKIPNIVLVFARFDSNRIDGEGSDFVKALRGLDNFRERLFDKHYSNVILVLTHFMQGDKKHRKNPTKKVEKFKKLVEQHSLFPKPIVVALAENKAEDEELPIINGFYQLPSGDFYPRNLFEKIQDSCTRGRDPIGESIIRTGFKYPENFNTTKLPSNLVHSTHAKVSIYLDLLNAANFKIDETEISNLLANAYKTLDPELKRKYPDTLPYMQRTLHLRNIITKANIPRTSASIIALLQNVRKTPAVIELLKKALRIQIPSLEINLLAGQGYDITKDESLLTSPFISSSKLTSDIGYYLPDILTCKLENDVQSHFYQFKSKDELYLERLKHLNIEEGVRSSAIQGGPQVGYNLVEDDSKALSGIWEQRRFQLILNDKAKLDPNFESFVGKLPPFNSSDYENVDVWKSFFDKYGTHVIQSAHGGGSIEINVQTSKEGDQLAEMSEIMRGLLVRLSELSENVVQSSFSSTFLPKSSDISHTLQFRGGDYKYFTTNLFGDSVRGATSTLNSWEESLNLQPVMLKTLLNLIPLSEVVRSRINPQKGTEVARAAKALFNASLIYTPPVPTVPPPPRNETSLIVDSLNARIDKLLKDFNAERQRNKESLEQVFELMKRENEKREAAMKKMLEESALAHERQLEALRRDKDRRANNPVKQWTFRFAYTMNADEDEVDALKEVMRRALAQQLIKLKEELMLVPMEVKPGFCDSISYHINMTYVIDIS